MLFIDTRVQQWANLPVNKANSPNFCRPSYRRYRITLILIFAAIKLPVTRWSMEFILNQKLTIVKNRKLYFVLVILAVGSVMMTSCSKGSTGPAGPAGKVGPAGPDSVQYSGWITLSTTVVKASNGDTTYQQSITANSITSAILEQGSVIGYVLLPDPVTGDSSVVNAATVFEEYFTIGYIDIVANSDWSGASYRYVIIPAKITTSSVSGTPQTYTSDQMKKMDYPTLTKVLGIPAKGSSGNSTQLGARLQ
jgi:hypothetical protein